MTTQPVTSFQTATLLIYSDAEAVQVLALSDFQSEWKALASKCPWGTALQAPEYVCTWYPCYEELYRPLVLVRFAPDGEMDGLMALAVERTSGKLTFAGAHQAEYQVWLALPGEQSFIAQALQRLRQLGFGSLTFTYLPPGVPLEWLKDGWSRKSAIRVEPKPLLAVDNADPIREALREKRTRRRLEKLQVDEPLSFVELRTRDELEAYYDDIIAFYDFRIGAVHGTCPFREDPRKRPFYRELMGREGLLHVAVMKVGQQLVAAHVGIRNGDEVTLFFVAHSPFFAMYSPVKLHTLQLGLLLHEEGFSSLDLTPGADAYKKDRANRYEDAYVLTIFLSKKATARHSIAASMRRVAKATALTLRLDRTKILRWRSSAGRAASSPIRSLQSLFSSIMGRIWSSTEMRLYRMETKNVVSGPMDDGVQRDSLRDLLCYEPVDRSCSSKQDFLREAMSKIESGAHAYSISDKDVLVNYGWLAPNGKVFITEVQHEYEYPPHSVVIQNVCTHPSFRRQGFCMRLLGQMLGDAAAMKSVEFVYVAVAAHNRAALRTVEKAGFEYQNSLIRQARFGRSKLSVAINDTDPLTSRRPARLSAYS